ncbi:MAG: DegQ family serine endoprotease [Alphaproteobacteria bacterium]|nr:DegQ family serine endoprotease [Alphaproteobacteria bacterium]
MRPVMSMLTRFAVIVLSVSVLLSVEPPAYAAPMPESFADEVDALMPTVVNVSTKQKVRSRAGMPPELNMPEFPPGSPFEDFNELFRQLQPYGDGQGGPEIEQEATSLGSGFVIDPSGYIVTNNHVIDGADEVDVRFSDNTELPAEIVGRDAKTDLALLKVKTDKPLKAAKFGDSDAARVGDWIIVIGNPFGFGGTVTAGIISARARDINAGPFDDFLQTDAAINRGNSGGPMFNMAGEVIGINSAIFSPSGGNVGIGFAIPTSLAQPVIEQLKTIGHARRAWLGVTIQTVGEEFAESLGLDKPGGAFVVKVTPGSPADKAGIKAGDIVLSFNGKDIAEMRKLPRMVAETPIGTKAQVTFWRKGETKKAIVTLSELKEEEQADAEGKEAEPKAADNSSAEVLGMALMPLSREVHDQLQLGDDVTGGLVITDINRTSKAWARGLRPHDVIIAVNEEPVGSIKQLRSEFEKAKKAGRKFALLRVQRGPDTAFVTLPTEMK